MKEKIKDILNDNNGYVTTKLLEANGIRKQYIPSFIEKKLLRKIAHGIYINPEIIEDEYYILQLRYKDVVFSYNTAFHLLGLSERVPYNLDVTTIQGKKMMSDAKVHYVVRNKFNMGIIEVESPYGNPIKIYNAERCICDMLKNPDQYEIELYNKIINNYFESKEKNLILLDEYAKYFNVYEKLSNIMEVLMK